MLVGSGFNLPRPFSGAEYHSARRLPLLAHHTPTGPIRPIRPMGHPSTPQPAPEPSANPGTLLRYSQIGSPRTGAKCSSHGCATRGPAEIENQAPARAATYGHRLQATTRTAAPDQPPRPRSRWLGGPICAPRLEGTPGASPFLQLPYPGRGTPETPGTPTNRRCSSVQRALSLGFARDSAAMGRPIRIRHITRGMDVATSGH